MLFLRLLIGQNEKANLVLNIRTSVSLTCRVLGFMELATVFTEHESNGFKCRSDTRVVHRQRGLKRNRDATPNEG